LWEYSCLRLLTEYCIVICIPYIYQREQVFLAIGFPARGHFKYPQKFLCRNQMLILDDGEQQLYDLLRHSLDQGFQQGLLRFEIMIEGTFGNF
jgi:hypothetical protein